MGSMRHRGQVRSVAIVALAATLLITFTDGVAYPEEVSGGGVTAKLPPGWHQRKPNPGALVLYTDQSFVGENCTLDSDRTTILLGVDGSEGALVRAGVRSGQLTPIPRPKHFGPRDGDTYTAEESADTACDATVQTIAFRDHGKLFVGNTVVGSDAPKKRIAEAYRILDSLRSRQ